jgi:cytochrome b561
MWQGREKQWVKQGEHTLFQRSNVLHWAIAVLVIYNAAVMLLARSDRQAPVG